MMLSQLRYILNAFETKVNWLEENYKKMHNKDFDEDKMKIYVNNKLQREMKLLSAYNIVPSVRAVETCEKFKY